MCIRDRNENIVGLFQQLFVTDEHHNGQRVSKDSKDGKNAVGHLEFGKSTFHCLLLSGGSRWGYCVWWIVHRRNVTLSHSFIHSLVINHIWYNNNIQDIYNTFKIIYTILTKLFTKLNVLKWQWQGSLYRSWGLIQYRLSGTIGYTKWVKVTEWKLGYF